MNTIRGYGNSKRIKYTIHVLIYNTIKLAFDASSLHLNAMIIYIHVSVATSLYFEQDQDFDLAN